MRVSASYKKTNNGNYDLSTVYKFSKVGIIPKDWYVKKIADISVDIFAGATPSTSISEYWNGDIPWMSSGEINKKIIWETEKYITEKGFDSSSTKVVPENSVLIALAGQGRTRGTVAMNKIKLCTNQSIASIIPNDMVDSKFLYYNLDNRYNELRKLSAGDGGRGGLNLQIIKNIYVGLPPKSEQQKIADILSTWDKAIELKEKLIEQKKEQKKGLIQRLLTGKVRLPGFKGEWRKVQLKDITIGNGMYGLNAPAVDYNPELPTYLRITDINDEGYINKEGLQSVDHPDSSKYFLEENDIVFARTGASTGRSYLYDKSDGRFVYAGFLIKFKIDPLKAVPKYIKYFTFTEKYKNWVRIMSARSGQPGINAEEYAQLSINLPSIEEQHQISEFLSLLDEEIMLMTRELIMIKQQKKGLMQLLLTGKVRVKC
jgi:type I restriction enzyme S subunit